MEEQALISVDLIDPNPYQPRQVEDAASVAEIAESIRHNGLMQVPSARQLDGRYQLAFGHTRLAAFKINGEECMPLILRELTDLQMFELGVAENIKRRDLNPIEQAMSMRRYMQEFNKNSVETSEFFNVSPEKVRGTLRYLNLPAAAQQNLAKGLINQDTARTLLSMQKIAPEKVIIETLKKIEKNKDSNPDEVIEHSIGRLGEVVDMWDESNNNGKPRSSWRNGWLLDMKNFPNKLLPLLTPVEIAVALGIQDDQEKIANANTWYLLKTGQLDPEIEGAEGFDLTPEGLGLSAELIEKLEHLISPPACTACPFYTKVRGSHYCGMKTCHTRKEVAWASNILQEASRNLGIALYQETDGKYVVLSYESKSLFASRNKGLRLIAKDQVKGNHYQWSFDGVNGDVFVVVVTGDAINKMIRSGSTSRVGKKTNAELLKMRQLRIYRPRRRELIWEFTLAAKGMLDALPYPILRKIDRWDYLQQELQPSKDVMLAENAPVDEEKANYLRRLIIWKMAVSDAWREVNNVTKFSDIVKRLEKLAQEWGVKMPKQISKMAEQFEAEVQAVSVETKKGKKS